MPATPVTPARAEHYRLHAEICRVLTDAKRLMLLDALRSGERSVGDLAEAIGVALPNASQHLAVLRAAGLVDAHRSGTSVHYRLAEPAIVEACDVIDRIVERRLIARGIAIPPAIGQPLAVEPPATDERRSLGAGARSA